MTPESLRRAQPTKSPGHPAWPSQLSCGAAALLPERAGSGPRPLGIAVGSCHCQDQGPLRGRTLPLSLVTLFPKPEFAPVARFYSAFINFYEKLYKVMEIESHQITYLITALY